MEVVSNNGFTEILRPDSVSDANTPCKGPRDNTVGSIMVSVAKMNGDIIQCCMPAESMVLDLIKAVEEQDGVPGAPVVHESHAGELEPVLTSQNGIAMGRHMKLSDYDICTGSTVMMVISKRIPGRYLCWMEIDTRLPSDIDIVKFVLEIKDGSASINDVEGTLWQDGPNYSLTLTKPVTLRSNRPRSRAFIQATGCTFTHNARNYSEQWWYPLEGKLVGNSNQPIDRVGRFKARRRDDCTA